MMRKIPFIIRDIYQFRVCPISSGAQQSQPWLRTISLLQYVWKTGIGPEDLKSQLMLISLNYMHNL